MRPFRFSISKLLTVLLLLVKIIVFSQIGPQREISMSTAFVIDGKCFDLDGDGDLDVLLISSWNQKVSWYENLGGGNFSIQKVISNMHDVIHCSAGDIDNDGDLDVVTASQTGNNLMWFENAGNGLFVAEHVISTSLPGASDVVLQDFDNDGDLDILTGTYTSDQVSWLENFGSGNFGGAQIISLLVNNAYAVHSADLDNDGDFDVLSASENDDKVAWYENLGGGNFGAQNILGILDEVESLYTSDLDNDGLQDVISSSLQDDLVVWYRNLGGGTFTPQIIISNTIDGANQVYAFDADNDGDAEVFVTSDYDNDFTYFENLGGGVFGPKQIIYSWGGANFNQIFAGDLDGDGWIDAITASSSDDRLLWYKNLGGVSFSVPAEVNDCINGATCSFASDLDNDGDLDVAVTSVADARVSWSENLGYGNFGPHNTLSIGSNNPWSVVCADLNGDGFNDVIAAHLAVDLLSWHANLGGGNFGPQQVISTNANSPYCVHAADLDNDGDVDILSASSVDNEIAWYENLGTGIFAAQQILSSTTYGARGVTTADVDGDNDLDVLAVGMDDTNIDLIENLGGGNFSPATVAGVSTGGACAIVAGDLDNDNDMDLLVARENDDRVTIYQNLGTGTFAPGVDVATLVNGPSTVQIADLNGDGLNDIIFGLRHDDEAYWRRNLGGMTFAPKILITDKTNYLNNIALGDLDNDGDLDVITSSRDDDKVAWYENYYGSIFELKGQLFFDEDQSGIMESDEHGLNTLPVVLQSNLYQTFTSGDGDFYFTTSPGVYTIPNPNLTYWNLTSDSLIYHATIDNTNMLFDSLNFGYYPDTLVPKMKPDLTSEQPICNNEINFWAHIQNTGTTISSGIVKLELDSLVSFEYAEILPDSIVGQTIFWHFDSLFYFADKLFNLTVDMPGVLNMGDHMTSVLTVYILDDMDSILFESTDTLNNSLFCAYDPNDKTVTPQGIGNQGFILANQEMEYLVRFQNTGTFMATDIIIRDQLDANLDWYSIQPISSSHAMTVWIEPGGEAVFEFKNIMLPDSNSNEPESHGFVKFRINQLPDQPPGTQFLNSASIFFDLNPPIITNSVLNTIYDCDLMEMTLNTTILCEGEELQGQFYDVLPGNTFWEIDTFFTQLSPSLNWIADTSGSFPVKLTYTNQLCSKDSLLQITINPAFSNSENLTICNGDSILIHGNYEGVSGSYTQTFTTELGCDSLIIKNLVVNPVYALDEIYSICDGDSILLFGNYVFSAGIYYDTLQSVGGCDSSLTKTLIINPEYSGTQNYLICDSDSIFIQGSYVSATGTYFDTLQTINGCDSTLTINLVVNQTYSFDQTAEICEGDSIQLYGTYYSQDGIYSHVLQTISGCDSTYTTALTVNESYNFVQTFSICEGDSALILGNYETLAGSYFDIHVTSLGCDSNYTAVLVVGQEYDIIQNPEICFGDSLYLNGSYQTNAGIYIDNFQTITGCDSTVTSVLTINPVPAVSMNPFTDDTICSDFGIINLIEGFPAGGVYTGNGVIANLFDPVLAGEGLHTITYTYVDTTSCANSDSTTLFVSNCAGIKNFDEIQISAYPNPTNGLIILEKSNAYQGDIQIRVYDSSFSLVLVHEFSGNELITQLDISNMADGIFYIELQTESEIYFEKFIKLE